MINSIIIVIIVTVTWVNQRKNIYNLVIRAVSNASIIKCHHKSIVKAVSVSLNFFHKPQAEWINKQLEVIRKYLKTYKIQKQVWYNLKRQTDTLFSLALFYGELTLRQKQWTSTAPHLTWSIVSNNTCLLRPKFVIHDHSSQSLDTHNPTKKVSNK